MQVLVEVNTLNNFLEVLKHFDRTSDVMIEKMLKD